MQKPKIKKPSKIVILNAAIISVTLLIGLVFIYLPFVKKTRYLKAEILKERDRNVLLGKIRAIDGHLKVYDKRVPAEGRGVSWLLNMVSDMASEQQMEIISIQPGPIEDRGLYIKLHVVLDTISTYHQLGKFTSKVESSEKFLRVENINIKRLDIGEGFKDKASRFKSFDISSHIVISTFVLK